MSLNVWLTTQLIDDNLDSTTRVLGVLGSSRGERCAGAWFV